MLGTKCCPSVIRRVCYSGAVPTYAVHDVDVKPIGIMLDDGGRAFFAQATKVGTQDGWRNDCRRRHGSG